MMMIYMPELSTTMYHGDHIMRTIMRRIMSKEDHVISRPTA